MQYTVILLFVLISLKLNGQAIEPKQKIGHADWEYILNQMPDYKQVEAELSTYETQLQNQLNFKTKELQNKYNEYKQLDPSTPDAIRRDKESEIAYLEDNIQKFQQDARVSIQKKQQELIMPIFSKVGKAIEEVAIENHYDYIINPQMIGGSDILLFTNEEYNISDLVLKKLEVNTKK